MKSLYLIGVVMILIGKISYGQTQGEINQLYADSFWMADKELNTVYQKVLKEYKKDTVFIRNLVTAQKIWIQFRDAEMKAKYPDRPSAWYGSIQPTCESIYRTELTKQRTLTLKIWLEGIEEGDVCHGSVKIKH